MTITHTVPTPQLLVLDDPLSAVDAQVCKHLFENVVQRSVAMGSAVVMVLNQLQYLPKCDNILFLGGGRVLFQGTHEELQANGTHCRVASWNCFL